MTQKLKIIQMAASSGPGGAEGFYLRLVRALHEHPEVEQLPIVREGSWLAERLREFNIPHETAPFGGLFDWRTRPRLHALFEGFQPHIAQTWMNRASRFLPRLENVPTVGRLGGYYNLKYYRNMTHLVGNTPVICDYIKGRGWPADKVSYIPNFVDMPRPEFRDHRLDVREEYGIPDHAKLVLMAGRLHENKGFDVALYALSRMADDVHVIIAGTGPQEGALKAMVDADGLSHRVHFAGWINSMTPLYAAADLFLHPARHEPLGNIILEAWAHGLPVVATKADGPKMLIEHGVTGLLVDLEDDVGIANALTHMFENPAAAKDMAQAGEAQVQMQFSQAAIVDKYLHLYRTLCGMKP